LNFKSLQISAIHPVTLSVSSGYGNPARLARRVRMTCQPL
jgi:hypothetical protein